MRLDHLIGSLETDKMANYIVLSKNPFDEPATELKDITPLAVVFDGKLIHGN